MKLLRVFAIALSLLFSFVSSSSSMAADQVSWAEGTLKKIDQTAKTAVIAHGPIDSIGMGAMTMQFAVKDAAGLAKLKAGDKVRFQAIMAGGDIVVTRIEAAK
jgi:Cu(I)/Ag(I) efflux system periplasmic protein CusF